MLWVLHPNPEARPEPKIFRIITSGEIFSSAGCTHIGTVEIENWFIAHCFLEEEGPQSEAAVISLRFQDDFKQVAKELRDAALES